MKQTGKLELVKDGELEFLIDWEMELVEPMMIEFIVTDQINTLEGQRDTVYLKGHLKWDGCANLRFSPDEEIDTGYYHWCSKSDWQRHCALMHFLWINLTKILPSFQNL